MNLRHVLTLLALLVPFAASAQPLFPFDAPWAAYNTGLSAYSGSPVALATGDFDHDGDADVVTALARSSSGFVFLRNDGEGRLGAPQHRPTAGSSHGIVAADFNEDGHLDVAVSDSDGLSTGNTVSVFLGNGDGTFGARQAVSVGAGNVVPVGIAAADFTGDGNLDLAVAAYGYIGFGSTVALLQGNGSGGFAAPIAFPAGPAPYRLEAGDLTGDGRPDLVVANRDYRVSVLRNDGAGGFAAAVAYPDLGENYAGPAFPDVALADVEGDGDLDVFYANTRTWTNALTGHAVQLRNNGTGTLARAADVLFTPYSAGPVDLATPDLNDDGAPDLVVAEYSARTSDGVTVRLNNGNGTFGSVAHYPAAQATFAVAAADLDGDGTTDLLTADDYTQAVTVRLNPGQGVFPVLPDDFAASVQFYLDAADVDGDDDLDMFTSGAGPSAAQGSILKNDGTGRFPLQTDVTVPFNGVSWGKLRDLNGDGRPDLLFNNNNTASQSDFFTALNNGDGTFPTPTRWTVGSAGWGHVDAFDLDNDGDLDVVDMEALGCPGCEPLFWVALNNGDGTFGAPYTIDPLPFRPYGVAGGDYNEDGNVDLAMTAWGAYGFDSVVMIALGNGDGTFDTPVTQYTVARGPKEIVTADLDGDGHLDLAVSSTGYNNEGAERLTVLFGTGSGAFTRLQQYYAPFSSDLLTAGQVRAGDVDADGDLDLMLQAGSNDVSIYVNDGNGLFTFPYRLGFTEGALNPYYGDFTGDGIPDLVAVRHRPPLGFDAGVAVLEGVSGAATAPVAVGAEPVGGPVVVGAGGGAFAFTVTLTNTTDEPQSFQAWSAVTGPVNRNPVVGPITVTLPAGATVTRTLTQAVPGAAPAGEYTYAVNVGAFPGTITASASFPVVKEDALAARPGGTPPPEIGGWAVSGWDEGAASAVTETPTAFALSAPVPNPAWGSTHLTLALPEAQRVTVAVFDALGRRVATLHDGPLAAGTHALVFDGSSLPAGLYVVRVTGETFAATRRATLLK